MRLRNSAGAWYAPSQLRSFALFLLLTAATAVAGWSQVVSATLLGTVTDSSSQSANILSSVYGNGGNLNILA